MFETGLTVPTRQPGEKVCLPLPCLLARLMLQGEWGPLSVPIIRTVRRALKVERTTIGPRRGQGGFPPTQQPGSRVFSR